jgi:hypothetical protein
MEKNSVFLRNHAMEIERDEFNDKTEITKYRYGYGCEYDRLTLANSICFYALDNVVILYFLNT